MDGRGIFDFIHSGYPVVPTFQTEPVPVAKWSNFECQILFWKLVI